MFLPMMFGSGNKAGNFSQWMSSMVGRTAKSGVLVTPETAIAVAAVRACVTLLANRSPNFRVSSTAVMVTSASGPRITRFTT